MHTILLIDSCPLTRECLATILRAKGYRVQSTSLISQAKIMIAKRSPDLIITEIRLPDDNALNLMRTLNADLYAAKIRVCLHTQAAAKKPIMEAIGLGACKVMLKSKFTIAGFLEQVSSLLTQDRPAQSGPAGPASDQGSGANEIRYALPLAAQDPALSLKDIKPIISRAQLNDRLEELTELQTLSEPITRLLQAIDSPEAEIDQVADLLKMDQAIAMKIMRIANSSTYARGEQTVTLKDAVLRIGLEHLRELVVGIGVIDALNSTENKMDGSIISFDHQLFWEHALGVAVCSSKIAMNCGGVNPEMAFTAAILHDIGRVMLIQALPELYPQVIDTSHRLGVGLELAEKRMLLTDHTTIAQTMLHAWNLPKDLVDAIANHHCPPSKLASVCSKNTKIAAVIELANRMVHAMGIGSSGNRSILGTEELFGILESPELSIESITDGFDAQINEMRSLIYKSTSGTDLAMPISKPNSPVFDRAFHPVYISMEPEFDAIGHWIMDHGDEHGSDEHPGPNIIIIHARQARDRQALTEKLTQAQENLTSGSGTQRLPVLILSASGKTSLADEALTRHPSMHLKTPFSVSHFEQAVNHLLNGMIRPIENWAPHNAA
jgi:putative nucleotidyltransferase with HDIG domain